MSAVARLLLAAGVPVSGSDAADGPTLEALRTTSNTWFCPLAALSWCPVQWFRIMPTTTVGSWRPRPMYGRSLESCSKVATP